MSKSLKLKNSHTKHPLLKNTGFTLIEIMVGISILGIISAIALPNLNGFIIKMRVDNEISELNRLILTARNNAINSGQRVVLCPLDGSNTCINSWGDTLSVFIDVNQNNIYEPIVGDPNGDTLLKIKAATSGGDGLTFTGGNNLTYAPTGLLVANNGNFNYCPNLDSDRKRGILISASGRPSTSSDLDNNGIDEFRDGTPIVCP